ncbi:hypothetical protein VKT23_014516 [Stygiomarasmius scandens]|uniref:FHA domain-containing protein n=1 Tax=Marasmiellus scandens TaxID=2682957 RepID=A0ABR1J4T9_9AGAR
MGPKPAPDQREKAPSKPVHGVEFIYEDPKLRPQSVTVLKDKASKAAHIGWKLFGNNAKSMGLKHAQLVFQNSKVLVSDLGSKKGTWVQSKRGPLERDMAHELRDGDRIVFGARADKGIAVDPEALRVKVKFIRQPDGQQPQSSPGSRPDSQMLAIPNKDPKRAVTPEATLKPPDKDTHRRTRSLQSSSKPTTINASNKVEYKVPSTILKAEIEIPWSESFRLGCGVNALTGESIPDSALRPGYKLENRPTPGDSQMVIKRIQWNEVKDLQDEFEMEAGGTVNVLSPAGAHAKLASVLSENSFSGTMLIQCKVYADFERQLLPMDIKMAQGLEKLSSQEFRDRYGDYYIAGLQKAYMCRMIVVCRINEETVTSAHEREAEALVGDYLRGKIKLADIEKQSTKCSLLNVIVDARGCSVDPNKIFAVTVESAKEELTGLIEKAPGVPRIAILYHYSRFKNCQLSTRLNVRRDMFDKAHAMRGIYAYLQACLLHPALKMFPWNSRSIRSACSRFEAQRRNLVQILTDDQKNKSYFKKTEPLYKELDGAKAKADSLIRRFDLINVVKDMNKEIRCRSFAENGAHRYLWACGKTGGRKKVELKEYNLVSFDSEGYKAYELEWTTPKTKKSGTGALLQVLGSHPIQTLTFHTRSSSDPVPLLLAHSLSNTSKLRKAPVSPATGKEKDLSATFQYCLMNHEPILILGWSLSCYWPDKKKEPVLELNDDPNNFILSDHLDFSVDASEAIHWHCTVTFVIKSAHNFPGLLE